MDLQALTGAATIALVSAFAFLLLAKSWQALARIVGNANSFPGNIMLEAAQRFRDEMEYLTRRLHIYLAAALVFIVIFSISYFLRSGEIFAGLPTWQLAAILAILVMVTLYALYRLISLMLARRRTSFVRDANIAAGHGLQKLTANRNRVFHDVRCAAGFIDNVIIGLHGIYAVHVVARRPVRDNRVRLIGETLEFLAGDTSISLASYGLRTQTLAREFRKAIKHEVRVRSVIAVPGWEIESQASSEYLVVNERNLAMLRGWKDQTDYLLDEQVEKLQELMTQRCTRS